MLKESNITLLTILLVLCLIASSCDATDSNNADSVPTVIDAEGKVVQAGERPRYTIYEGNTDGECSHCKAIREEEQE